jgi:phosphoenolpyruvate carboxylase
VTTTQDDPHAALRDDIRRLGELLGQVITEQQGPDLLATVEHVRALSKADRASDAQTTTGLRSLLRGVGVEQAVPLARAFSLFLSLSNIAEQHHRIRRRSEHRRQSETDAQHGSFTDCLQRLLAAGVTAESIQQRFATIQVEMVLTAHPTEINRRTNLRRYQAIAELLLARDRHRGDALRQLELDEQLAREITILWLTDEVRSQRACPEAAAGAEPPRAWDSAA